MQTYKYTIYQGVMSESGVGDMDAVGHANTLAEARKIFNKVKKDTKGWVKKFKNNFLETHLWNNIDDKIIDSSIVKF